MSSKYDAAANTPQLRDLRDALRQFAAERDWEQFHTPKNLAMALNVEAGELLEHFQWLSPEESAHLTPEQVVRVKQEMADVFLYLIRLADRLDLDLMTAAAEKLVINARKYPAALAKGTAKKYTDL